MVMYTSIDFLNEATASMQLEPFDHEMLQSPFELKLAEKIQHLDTLIISLYKIELTKPQHICRLNETNQFIAPDIFYRLIYSSIYVHDFSIKRQSIHYQMLQASNKRNMLMHLFCRNEINQHFK